MWRLIQLSPLRLLVAGAVAAASLWAQTEPPPRNPFMEERPPVTAPGKPKISPLAEIPDWKKLAEFANVLTKQEFEDATSRIYTQRSGFPLPWKVEGEAVIIETGPGAPPVKVAFRTPASNGKTADRYWSRAVELPPLQPGEPVLKGIHIALDPGHIGGAYARIEERWLSMNPGEQVMEGSLVLQVANLLKPRLEAFGAQVSLVRNAETPVTTSKPEDFKALAREVLKDAGIAEPLEAYTSMLDESRILTVQWQTEKLFYRVSEIRARAQKVNQDLRPDLVVCLHLNAEAWGNPAEPALVQSNHFHLLINGCYSADELATEDVRYDMFRRLFGKVHEEELAMADVVATAIMQRTGLPPYVYLQPNARRVSANPAVFARNLLASRLYQCPVLYLEPYVMNDELTYRRLLLGQYLGRTLVEGQLVTSPLEDYARGVLQGVVEYYQNARTRKE